MTIKDGTTIPLPEELPDFDEEELTLKDDKAEEDPVKKHVAAINTGGFRDFLLKPELIRALQSCGFEHPAEVQHACIPQAVLGTDVLCQAKSGMGKTAVFVLACLQQLKVNNKESNTTTNTSGNNSNGGNSSKFVQVLVVAHTRELAYQIKFEFDRFSKFLDNISTAVVYGGTPILKDKEMLKNSCPDILIGTPGRLLGLLRNNDLSLEKVSHFILDECDKALEKLDMRHDVQDIFFNTPRRKQVMMFTATMTQEMRVLCKKFMNSPHEIHVDSDAKLRLTGLLQYYEEVGEKDKNRRLNDLLDALEFNQVVIFVKSVSRAIALQKLLKECQFPAATIHSGMDQEERIKQYKAFKTFQTRIMVSTDLFGRGIDIEKVNIVVNYDAPDGTDTYLHRVGRAGRFGTKGLAITFVSSPEEHTLVKDVQERFVVAIEKLPANVDPTSYLNA